jgi:hypothetical protein
MNGKSHGTIIATRFGEMEKDATEKKRIVKAFLFHTVRREDGLYFLEGIIRTFANRHLHEVRNFLHGSPTFFTLLAPEMETTLSRGSQRDCVNMENGIPHATCSKNLLSATPAELFDFSHEWTCDTDDDFISDCSDSDSDMSELSVIDLTQTSNGGEDGDDGDEDDDDGRQFI